MRAVLQDVFATVKCGKVDERETVGSKVFREYVSDGWVGVIKYDFAHACVPGMGIWPDLPMPES